MIKLAGMTADKLAVIPLFDPSVSKGGIIIPDMAKDRCDQGIVKYVGPECNNVKPGDYVMYSGYTGTAIQTEEGVLIIMREEGVIATFAGELLDDTEIPGLFFEGEKDDDGGRTFFPATFEFATDLIARALQEAPWRADLKSKEMMEHRPKNLLRR